MKTKSVLAILSLPIVLACNPGSNRSFIPGTYAGHSKGDYSLADDTLVIQHEAGNQYSIHRKTGFNLIRNGRKGIREHETEDWKAVYDEKSGLLREIKRGKTLLFYPNAGKLMIGSREYIKLN